ncbi:MAG TPA: multiheme c-type cytochrome [Candidatus Acidoferrales bacterium]|nr:multiheme c-type cytochrome [Candidatus Acidoferrales bacterium]
MNTKLEAKPLRLLLPVIAILAGSAILSSLSFAQTRSSAPEGVGKYTGPGSCASTSCHGSVTPRTENDVLQNEYSTWIVKDKHSKSYAALTGKIGERMAGILGLGKAETAPRCLACHALNVAPEARARTFDVSEGVSCESCHGPAAGWLGPHTERDWTHEKSVALGMYDTRDLVKRTEKCLSCHLGGEDKFVNHEMIAAGHPDLFFELDSFSAVMPRHWKETGDAAHNDPWYDVRELTTGQAVQLRESMLRLASRSRGKIWPEYSEMQCYACHHSLTPPEQSWRQARGYVGRRPGDPPWNASRFAVFRDVVHQLDGPSADQLDAGIAQVTQLMSQLNPDRDAVASAAANSARLADALVAKINAANYDPASTLRLLQKISADADDISAQGEQSAAQAAMALQSLFVAYDRDVKFQNSAELRGAISALFQQLENPSAYDPDRFARQMQQVNALLH